MKNRRLKKLNGAKPIPPNTKKVLVFGTFDLLHPGHKYFLRQAKKHGDKLYVIVARDKNVKKIKKYWPIHNELIRVKKLNSLIFVTKAILGNKNLKKRYLAVLKIKPDIICLGYDQKFLTKSLKKDLTHLGLTTKIIRLKPLRPNIYKSTLLRQK